MRAPIVQTKARADGLPGWEISLSEDRKKARTVGYLVEEHDGGFRVWKEGESSAERLFRGLFSDRWEAIRSILPPTDFPEVCVRCGEAPPVEDAAAYEYNPGTTTAPWDVVPYPSELDDHCEDCLPEGLEDLISSYEP